MRTADNQTIPAEKKNPSPPGGRKKICIVTTTPLIVNFFLGGILEALSRRFEISLVVNTQDDVALRGLPPGTRLHPVLLQRKISPLRDLAALWRLWRIFRSGHYDAVHSFAPKAGLLAMLAAKLARIPVRVHTFQGEVWAARRGVLHRFLKAMDVLTARCTSDGLVISRSEREFLVREGVLKEGRSRVLAEGSVCGVDMARFEASSRSRAAVRRRLGIGPDDTVFLFLGRLTRDKGILDLARAFSSIAAKFNDAQLLVVGPDEEDLEHAIRRLTGNASSRLHVHGYTDCPEEYIAAADVVCLPSYREGFGMVLIEAGAAGLPAIASRIYGIADAVIEGETALLHRPGAVDELSSHMTLLIEDSERRKSMGARAHDLAARRFSHERVIGAYLEYYIDLLS